MPFEPQKVVAQLALGRIPSTDMPAMAWTALRLAQLRARQILQSGVDPLREIGDFYMLWREAEYCREIQNYGILGDEVNVALLTGTADAEVRAWVVERLTRLIQMKEGE